MTLPLLLLIGAVAVGIHGQNSSGVRPLSCDSKERVDVVLKVDITPMPTRREQKAASEASVRELLWRNWRVRQRACVEEKTYTREGDQVSSLYQIKRDSAGRWGLHHSWNVDVVPMKRDPKYPRTVEGEFWAYSVELVVPETLNSSERVLSDNEEYSADVYRIVFRDNAGRELMRY